MNTEIKTPNLNEIELLSNKLIFELNQGEDGVRRAKITAKAINDCIRVQQDIKREWKDLLFVMANKLT